MAGATSPSSSASASAHRSGLVSTFQNLVKPFIGAGILALPAAFKEGGLLASVALMALMALMANYCIRCLLQCLQQATLAGYLSPRQKTAAATREVGGMGDSLSASLLLSPLVDSASMAIGHPSLQRFDFSHNPYSPSAPPTFRDIGDLAFGSWGKYAVDVSLVLSQLGFCTAYVAFIGDNMGSVFPSLSAHHWMLLAMTLLAVLCQIRQVSTIAFTSAIGNAVYLVSIVIIFIDGASHETSLSGRNKETGEAIVLLNLRGLPLVFGTACFALEGIGLILPVKAAMRDADQHRFYTLLNVAVALVASAYILFGVFGYLFYGEAVVAPVTGNLTAGTASDAVRVSLSISLFFSYILQMFPVNDISDYAIYCALRSSAHRRSDDDRRAGGGGGSGSSRGEARERDTADEGLVDGEVGQGRSVEQSLAAPIVAASTSAWSGPLSPASPFTSARTPHLTLSMVLVQCVVRAGWVGLTALVAIVVSNFGFVVSLTGSLANSLIAFILPALFYARLVVHDRYPQPLSEGWTSAKGYVLPVAVVISGVCASIVGVYSAIADEIRAKS